MPFVGRQGLAATELHDCEIVQVPLSERRFQVGHAVAKFAQ